MDEIKVVEAFDAYFRSANSVPVERATVPASEWVRIREIIDGLRAGIESERKLRLRAEGLTRQWLDRHDIALESLNEALADKRKAEAEAVELANALRGSMLLHGMTNEKIGAVMAAIIDAANPRYTITEAGRAKLAGEGK